MFHAVAKVSAANSRLKGVRWNEKPQWSIATRTHLPFKYSAPISGKKIFLIYGFKKKWRPYYFSVHSFENKLFTVSKLESSRTNKTIKSICGRWLSSWRGKELAIKINYQCCKLTDSTNNNWPSNTGFDSARSWCDSESAKAALTAHSGPRTKITPRSEYTPDVGESDIFALNITPFFVKSEQING